MTYPRTKNDSLKISSKYREIMWATKTYKLALTITFIIYKSLFNIFQLNYCKTNTWMKFTNNSKDVDWA